MGSTRAFFRRGLCILLALAAGKNMAAQMTPPPASLTAEIAEIEHQLADQSLSGIERHDTLVRLARLAWLGGDFGAAARAWTDAAFADPGRRDDEALVESARCQIALGEFDEAAAEIKNVLLTGRDPQAMRSARFLEAQLDCFRTGSTWLLAALLRAPDYADRRASIYCTLWMVTADPVYRDGLLAECPASPEALIVGSVGNVGKKPAVSAANQTLWFLFPGREEGVAAGAPAAGTPAESAAALPTAYQTGLFGQEANARSMAARLKAAGFTPSVSPRTVNGAAYWAVTVPAGRDTVLALKDAGFESFPVF